METGGPEEQPPVQKSDQIEEAGAGLDQLLQDQKKLAERLEGEQRHLEEIQEQVVRESGMTRQMKEGTKQQADEPEIE